MTNFLIKNIKHKNYKLYLLVIFFVWIFSLLIYFFFSELIRGGALENGVKLGNDSFFYLGEAQKIINGDISILENKSKAGYLLFLIPFLHFELPLYYIVLFNIILTFISALCLYKITTKYFCKSSGLICVMLFLFYFPLQISNFYILTETLFINISLMLTFFIVFFKKKYLSIILLLLLTLISIRPNGILFLFSLIITFFLFFIEKKKYLYLFLYSTIILILSFPIINFLNIYLHDLNLINSMDKGIIWGYSFETKQACKASCLGIELINNDYSNTLLSFIQFIFANFFEYFKIFLYKIFWLIIRARPYYSDLHNIYLLFFSVILYMPFFYGFVKKPKNLFSINYINFYILLSIILVGLTFADWSGRFSLPILPFIMIFSSYGILTFIKKILNMVSQKRDNAS